jgi:hypothetical protein
MSQLRFFSLLVTWPRFMLAFMGLAVSACQGDFHGNGWVTPATEREDTSTGGAQGADDPQDEPSGEPEAPVQEPEPPAEPEEPDPADEPDAAVPPDPVFGGGSTCTSGQITPTEEDPDGSQLMAPGRPCIGCHQAEDDGPEFALAGTVYETGHEPDDCHGGADPARGAPRIEVTDADGKVVAMDANQAGNFFSSSSVRFPIRARVRFEGRTRSMLGEVSSGDCNGCHTEAGANGAPGRIALP